MTSFLRHIGIIQQGLDEIPQCRMQSLPMDGTGIILIISNKGEKKFGINAWQLLPAGGLCALAYGSPLMPE